jgi:hypothetical protein
MNEADKPSRMQAALRGQFAENRWSSGRVSFNRGGRGFKTEPDAIDPNRPGRV